MTIKETILTYEAIVGCILRLAEETREHLSNCCCDRCGELRAYVGDWISLTAKQN